MRTIIDIPDHILNELDALAQQEKISRAEAVRRAMSDYLKNRTQLNPDAGFAIWKSKQVDSLSYEDEIRGEWER